MYGNGFWCKHLTNVIGRGVLLGEVLHLTSVSPCTSSALSEGACMQCGGRVEREKSGKDLLKYFASVRLTKMSTFFKGFSAFPSLPRHHIHH